MGEASRDIEIVLLRLPSGSDKFPRPPLEDSVVEFSLLSMSRGSSGEMFNTKSSNIIGIGKKEKILFILREHWYARYDSRHL